MSNKNFNHNDNESFMEGIYGCLERIETGIIELQKTKPSDSNSVVDNEANETIVEDITDLVANATGLNCRHTDRKLEEQTKVLNSNFSAISESVRDVKAIVNKSQSSGEVLNSLAEIKTIQEQKSYKVKTLIQKLKTTIEDGVHNFKHHRIGFETPFVCWTIVIETALILGLFTWIIISEKPNQNRIDNDLKYRYIKMKGDASAEQIATLEDIFELNRDKQKIEQMREDVETYEEAVRKQAALAEQARLKEQEQRNKNPKPCPLRTSKIIVRLNKINQNPDCNMTTVKIKFRPSTVDGGQGSIFYQVIHNRVARQQKTGYRLYGYEWNSHSSEVVLPKFNESRKRYLSEIGDKIRMDVKHFQKVIANFEHSGCDYTADDVIAEFSSNNPENFLLPFMEGVIANLKTLGKIRTSETYAATLCSFRRFREDKDVPLDDMDSDMMMAYEAYLKNNGVSPNSSSFYMRNLRAVYNRAVEKGLTSQRFPFKYVYTGVDKTVKRAVPLKVIKRIKEMDFSMNPSFDFARDMFLMSFYTRGMSFVDMAYLRKKDLQNGVLSYRRRKTRQQLFIKWEKCMQEIVDKYDTLQSNYLLPIIKPFGDIDERKQYIYAAHNINRCLKIIGKELGLSVSLTLYVARHAWASIAKSKNVPLSVISEGMGHDSEATTRIYLASLDTVAIDKANSMILKSL